MKVEKEPVMSGRDTVVYYLLCFVGLTSVGVFGLWWFRPEHVPHNFAGNAHYFDFSLFAIVTYVVWISIINGLFFWYVLYFMKRPKYISPEENKRVALLTAFVPGKEPYDILENTLKAMTGVDYPHETWLLDEGDEEKARELCRLYGVKHYSRKGIAKYNTPIGMYKAKTKAGNYNSWYDLNGKKYDFVAQIDVDFVPKKNFLTRTLGYFRDPQVAFVGSPQIYGNLKDSWIVHGAAEQAYGFFGPMQKGFYGMDMQLFIGANHIVREAAHNDINGYSGHIVEDHLTGMRFYANKWKSVYVPEILAVGEGPASWDAYFNQQMRWAYGLIDILFYQSPRLFLKMRLRHIINYFLLQQYYFYGLAQVLGILLLSMYFVFGIESTAMVLWELLLLYPTVILIQEIIYLWSQKFNIDPSSESGFMIRAKFLNLAAWPIYFIAFMEALMRKKLTYIVTPKGIEQKKEYIPMKLFLPHFILGSITFFDIYISIATHNQALQLLFWAYLNTFAMYYFTLSAILKNIFLKIEKLNLNPPSPSRLLGAGGFLFKRTAGKSDRI